MNSKTLIDRIINKTAKVGLLLREIEDVVRAEPTCEPVIHIKNAAIVKELFIARWHPILIDVVQWVIYKYPGRIVFTSGHRTDSAIHNTDPLRATDLRSSCFDDPKLVMAEINKEWDYGKGDYEVCLYHRKAKCLKCGNRFEIDPDTGITEYDFCPKCNSGIPYLEDLGPHFHIQVCGNTKKRGVSV